MKAHMIMLEITATAMELGKAEWDAICGVRCFLGNDEFS